MKTRTGHFPIGVRQLWMDWHQDVPGLIAWAKANGIEGLDLGPDADVTGPQVKAAGLRIGSVDLRVWQGMLSPEAATRQQAVKDNAEHIARCAALGPLNHFVVMLPEQPERPRAENFGYMIESFTALAPVFERHAARLVIEGWPGPGALCCTPEGYRRFFEAVPSPAMGINYDPSHLLRMGIDPVRFLVEFASRVYHVHGKDTELMPEHLYEFGHEQPATFAAPLAYGGHSWRYTIPGHGQVRWGEILAGLQAHGYQGQISIELEDVSFNGTEAGEKAGLLAGAAFLSSV
jgi:sugar phosphate isomerase/epimerase